MPIIYIEGHSEFKKIDKPNEYIMLFKADWNLPSKAMHKIVCDSASKNPTVTYYILDIAKHKFDEELKEYGVFGLPTAINIKQGAVRGISVGTSTRLQFAIFTGLN